MSTTLDKISLINILNSGKINLQGQFLLGSNYTFFAELIYESDTIPVVYKPRRGERPLWDFPVNTLGKREVAAYLISDFLEWDLVPPVIYRRRGPLGPGSLQLFIDHDPEYHYFKFSETDRQRLRPATLFDLIINNADRKAGHILIGKDDHLWLIDHGICFNTENKLRTVLWEFIGQPIPPDLLSSLNKLVEDLQTKGQLFQSLRPYLRVSEINAIIRRSERVLDSGIYPTPSTRFPVPYPPI